MSYKRVDSYRCRPRRAQDNMNRQQLIAHLTMHYRPGDQIRIGAGTKALEIDDIGYYVIDEMTDKIIPANKVECHHEHVVVLWPRDEEATKAANGERSPMPKSRRKKPRKRVKKNVR